MKNNADERNTSSVNALKNFMLSGIMLFNAVYSAYVVNYTPKIGIYHMIIPEDTANEFKAKESYEYDYDHNLLKYYDKITATYFPNSKVIIRALAEG